MNRLFFGLCASAVGCAFALQFPAVAIAKSKETILHSFSNGSADGQYPLAALVDVKGTLYGTTFSGGTGGTTGLGTVYSVNPKTGAEALVYSFQSGTDGEFPAAGMIDVKGTLYGTTEYGGTYGLGTVFSVDPTTGAENVVYSLGNGTDGSGPTAELLDVNGTLYGTTDTGGAYNHGTVFSLDPSTGAETVLYSFCSQTNCTDGEEPFGAVIDVNGTLYGTTLTGGANTCSGRGCGTVYAINLSSGAETVAYSFAGGSDGATPYDSLLDMNGTLYGTTAAGGTTNLGTAFSLDPTTGAETVLHAFGSGSDGISPAANLVDVKGTLYSITFGGGNSNHGGTVFSLNPSTGKEKVIWDFCDQQNCTDGAQPDAGVIAVKGKLYGTTELGGANGSYGTVFALKKL